MNTPEIYPEAVKDSVTSPLSLERYRNAYEPFASTVLSLKQEAASLADPRQHPAHLGHPDSRHGVGTFKDVYRLPEAHGLVVGLFKETDPTTRAEMVKLTTTDLSRLRNLKGFVHIVASSPEEGAVISHELPGKPSEEANDAILDQLSLQVLTEAVDNIDAASKGGIFLDRHPGNILLGTNIFFLDPLEGLHTDRFAVNIQTLAYALAYAGETNNTASEKARRAVLNRLHEVVQKKFSNSTSLYLLESIMRRFREK